MGWLSKVAVLVMLRYISLSAGVPQSLPLGEGYFEENGAPSDVDTNVVPALESKLVQKEIEGEENIQQLTNYLAYILLHPWPVTGLPLLYVEDYPEVIDYEDRMGDLSKIDGSLDTDNELRQIPFKRSRYYRKYPWKRQNSRETYEPENRYLCQPSKEDVFRLLVALHEARQGNKGQTIHFCNRKRPATAIFTNIRFLGRRK